MTGLALFVALVAVLAAVALFLQGRTTRTALGANAAELEKLRKAVEIARGELQTVRADAKERREEASALRAELAASKKKAFEQAEAAKRAGGAAALRADIEKLTTRLADARAETGAAAEHAKALEAQLEKSSREADRLRAEAQRATAAPVAPAAAPLIVTPAEAAPAAPAAALSPVAAEKDRADKAEAKAAEARKRVAELERDLKGARGRLETEKRIYIVQKGELELAQDRHAELRRRYDAQKKDHDELVEAVRQAAQEDRRLAEADAKARGASAGETSEAAADKPVEGSAA
jgi:colicin import membrane protein